MFLSWRGAGAPWRRVLGDGDAWRYTWGHGHVNARDPHPDQQLGNSPALGGSLFTAKNGYKMESGHGWETFRGPVKIIQWAYPDDVCNDGSWEGHTAHT
jgi:hypothetical protein